MTRGLLEDLAGDLYTVLTGRAAPEDLDLSYGGIKQRLVKRAATEPIDTMISTAVAGTVLLYLVERDANPGVRSIPDAFRVVTSCLAAVSGEAGAVTPAGKYLLGWITAAGPVLQLLGAGEGAAQRPAPALDPAVVARLERITELLEKIAAGQPGGAATPGPVPSQL